MEAESFAEALRRMTPESFAVVEGCVLWPDDDPPSAERVRSHLQQLRTNYGSMTAAPLLEARVRASYEHDFNRRFLVRELAPVAPETWTPQLLVACGRSWTVILRDALRRAFPHLRFDVELVGEAGAEDEPLEVCVTFSQRWADDGMSES
jgi:hypothetical protein